ncbi:MAG TPA: hypothetical protein VKX49_12580 [Bryobacteraceae bacterium]|nr:hypothetical protein [Bryobacteraceae bacterium]
MLPVALDVKPPQFANPLDQAARLYSLKGAIQENQLRAQQVQAAELENQQRQTLLQDQNTIKNEFAKTAAADPSKPVDWNSFRSGLDGKVSPTTLLALDADHLKMQQAAQELALSQETTAKSKYENLKTRNLLEGQALAGILQAPPEKKMDFYQSALDNLRQRGIDTKDYPPTYPGDDEVMAHAAKVGYLSTIFDSADKMAKAKKEQTDAVDQEVSSFAKNAPDNQEAWTAQWKTLSPAAQAKVPAIYSPDAVAKLTRAQVPVAERPKYDIDLMNAAAAANMNPAKLRAQVDGVIDPRRYPLQNQRAKAAAANALQNGLGLKGVNDAIEKGAQSVQEIEREVDPGVINARVQGTVQAQRQLNASSNAALSNVPPHLIAPATANYTKISDEYADAVNAADEMQSIIDLAKSGNKVAYAYAPTTGVLTINAGNQVKRVNMPEIQTYGGAGSALDRLQGWLGKQTSGQSIPPQILDAMQDLHGTLAKVAAERYSNKINVLNQSYGSTFKGASIQPRGSNTSTKGSDVPAIPPSLSQSDVGKIYFSPKTGKKLKITAVNPSNPKLFTAEDVQ